MDIKKYELSTPQKSIWLTEQIYNGTNIGTISGTLFIDEVVNIDLLKETIKIFINKNDSMRTRIIVEDGNPKQFINAVDIPEIEVLNINNEIELKNLEKEVSSHVFNLINSELYIFKIFKLPNGTGGIVSNLHHLIADAWSFGIMSKQLKDIYEKLLLNEDYLEEKPSYTEYIENEKNYFVSEKYIKDKDYWQNRFLSVPDLACIKPYNNENASTNANRYKASLDTNLCKKINRYAKENNTSAYSFLMSIFSIYLSRVSSLDSIIIGTPFLNRTNFKEKNTMGMFVNTLPNRLDINWNLKFSEYLKYVTEEQRNMFRHSKYPYNQLLEKVRKDQNITRNLYDITMSYQNARNDSQISNIKYHTYWNYCGNINESMEIHVFDMDNTGSLQLLYDYQTVKFSEEEIKDIHLRILHIINQVLDNEIVLKDIEIVTPEEKQKLLYDFNNTKSEYPRDKTIAQVFEDVVMLNPKKTAIVFENESLSYEQLNEKSNKLARYLSANGVNSKDNVVILAEKSIDLYVSIMAILKLGALYVPVDNEYPEDRIKLILDDCKPKVVIVDEKSSELVKNEKLCTLPLQGLEDFDGSNLENKITAEDGAYIIYTSGSTGKPKGVMVPNRGVVRLVKNTNYIEFKETDRILQNIPVVFDASTFAIFGSLLNGLTLYPIQKEKLLDFEYLEKFIKENNINIINSTVTFFNKLIEFDPKIFSKCRSVLIGGEEVLPKTVNIFRQNNPKCDIVNVYGPTENSNLSSCHIIKKDYLKSVPIGIPVSNSTCYILDKDQNLLPIGIPGELYVGGDGVALGYLNNPELTNEKFVPNIFGDGKLYKTGDLCYWENEGIIEFISRIDSQVKIRGFRIELKEIETKILEFGHMKECAVIIADNKNSKMLVGCIGTDEEIDIKELNSYLKSKLPSYMVPSKYILVDNLPLNINGKLDAKKLLKELDKQKDEIIPPRNKTDKIIINALSQVLSISNASITDSVFDLGADSLSCITFTNLLTKELGITITVQDIFNYPIIEDLSNYISNLSTKSAQTVIKVAEKMPYYPITNAQKRIYYSSIIDSNSTVYNTAGGIIIDKVLDTNKLEKCFKNLINRHDALRTCFKIIDNNVVQIINEDVTFNLITDTASSTKLNDIYTNFVKPFNLEKAPLLRAKAVTLDNNKMLLLLDMHHIISDGTSLSILLQELCDLYNDKQLKEKKLDYKDFTLWEKEQFETEEFKSSKDFWVNQFKDEIPLLNMPYVHPRPSVQSFEGANYHIKLSNDIFNKINDISKKLNITPYMLMLSCYYILLSKYTMQDDIVVGTPIVGRELPELFNMLGMFVNTLALRTSVDHSLTFNDFTNKIKECCLSAFEHQNYPFDELVKDLNIKKDTSRNPLFDVMFIYQNNGYPKINFNNTNIEYFIPDNNISKFDLSLEVIPINNEYSLRFEYCTKLFDEDFIGRLSSHYINILTTVLNNCEIKISDIDMLSKDERNKILYEFNDIEEIPNNDTFVSLFEEQVALHPNNMALICNDKKLTYLELNKKANSLAYFLLNNNVKPNDIIAIMTDRSFETVISMLAILKVGAAFVNIDPTYPIERTLYYLNNCKAKYLLKQKHLKLPTNEFKNIFEIDLDIDEIYSKYTENLNINIDLKSLSYIIYTSGSTGIPKGAALNHIGLANMCKAMTLVLDYLKDATNHTLLSVTSTPFDIFVYEIVVPLSHGMKIVLANNSEHRNPKLIDSLIRKYNVDVMTVTPSLMKINYDNREPNSALANVKNMVFGGEPLSEKFVHDLKNLSDDITIYNIYGPCEITVLSNVQNLNGEKEINIGPPILNTKIYVLDNDMNPVPIGFTGEIYIGGIQVGCGYIGNKELTDEKFIANPFAKGKMFKSGDIGRWTKDGKLQCLGRFDNQIKLRGLRIELGEIEKILELIPEVDEAIVNKVVVNEKEALCAYYVLNSDIDESLLRNTLKSKLPYYMVPTYFMKLDNMPYSVNRKIDRKALPIPDSANVNIEKRSKYTTNISSINQKLLYIWEKVLNLSNISVNDNFFDIGGDSLSAIKMQIEAVKNGINIEYSDIFKYPTIKLLSSNIEKDKFFDISSYNSLEIDKLLQKNNVNSLKSIRNFNVKNILVIGTTGYLGIHLIYDFLTKHKGNVYCLVRPKNRIEPEQRLEDIFTFYFGKKNFYKYKKRMIIVKGDITMKNIGISEEHIKIIKNNVNTVINSGALVKHYGESKMFEDINVSGTQNVVNFCIDNKLRLLHISTVSVSGNGERIYDFDENNKNNKIFSEQNLYINQKISSIYTYTKFKAESIVLNGILSGLDATILRVGNITNRYSDGVFQRNYKDNAFAQRIKSFIEIGAFPEYFLEHKIDLTPVDLCAEAIITILYYKSDFNILHIYNNNLLSIELFFNVLQSLNIKLVPVSNQLMTDIITGILEDDNRKDSISGIIYDLDKNKNLIYTSNISLDSTVSNKYLSKIGFNWKKNNKNYIKRCLYYFDKINFIKFRR